MNKISDKIPNTIAFVLRDTANGFASSFQMIGEPVTDLMGRVADKELLLLKTEVMKFLFHIGNFLLPSVFRKHSSARLRILNADAKSMNSDTPPIARQCNGKEKDVIPKREPGKAVEVI